MKELTCANRPWLQGRRRTRSGNSDCILLEELVLIPTTIDENLDYVLLVEEIT